MNSFGQIFRVSIYGESHGPVVGICIDGVPPGIAIALSEFEPDLARRRPTKKGTTPRKEADIPIIKSGVYQGFTTGSPLTLEFINGNTKPKDYDKLKATPRPGHADFVAEKKYRGFQDHRGGGHFSGRLTVAIVAAGVIAKKIIDPINITAQLIAAGGSRDIEKAIDEALNDGDSIGGLIECKTSEMPIGLGEPFFDSIESSLAHILFAIPAVKGVEFGSGFEAAFMRGSEHNDLIINPAGKTESNNAGGINGGISNGNDLRFRIAVKPPSSISRSQNTVNLKSGQREEIKVEGRHDACIALRAPVVVEAAAAIVLADLFLRGE